MSVRLQWTAEEDQALRDAYAQGLYARHTVAMKALAVRKGTSVSRCRYRALKLGLTRHQRGGKPWTATEQKMLREMAGKFSASRIALKLGRSVAAVNMCMSRLELQGRVINRGYRRYELCALMGITERTFYALLKDRAMERNRFGNYSKAEVQMWIFELLEQLELRRFDQDFLKQMLKGVAA
jgi:DNA-binding CsgD family transcriptional regulator